MISNFYKIFPAIKIPIKIVCNWTDTNTLYKYWKKMLLPNSRLVLVTDDTYEYLVIINNASIANTTVANKKIIWISMEPNQTTIPPSLKELQIVATIVQTNDVNPVEWNIHKTYSQLLQNCLDKKIDKMSTILSAKYHDVGHITRIDFIKYLEQDEDLVKLLHVYGDNKWDYKTYQKPLPYHQKDDGLFPYKYTFNVENHQQYNYVTEKLYDAILSETLCFYNGCPNIKSIIDERAYIYLELKNFEHDKQIILNAIQQDLWSQRIEYIRQAKFTLLNKLNVFAQIEKKIIDRDV